MPNNATISLEAKFVDNLSPQFAKIKSEIEALTGKIKLSTDASQAAKQAAEAEATALKAKIAALKGNTEEEVRQTKALRDMEQATLAAKTGDEKLAAEIMDLRDEYRKLSVETQNATRAAQAVKDVTEQEIVPLRAKIAALQGNYDEEAKQVKILKDMEQATLAAKLGDEKLAKEIMDLRAEEERLSGSQDKHTGILSKLNGGLSAAGLGFVSMGAAIVGALKGSIDLEDAMIKVQKTSGLTDKEIADLTSTFRDMSMKIPLSSVALAGIGEIAGQLGIEGSKNIASFTETIGKMTTVTDLSVNEAATGMATLANLYKIPIPNLSNLGSAINELENRTTATAGQLIDFMERVGGKAGLLGIGAEAAAGLGATLKDLGVDAEIGGTAMSEVLGDMLTKTKQFASESGVSVQEWKDLVVTEPVKALELWLGKLNELNQFDKIAAIEAIIGSDQRAVGAVLKLVDATDQLSKNIDISTNAFAQNTSLQQEFEKRVSSSKIQIEFLWNGIKDLGITLGDVFLPVLNLVVNALNGLVSILREIPSWFSGIQQSISDAGGAFDWIIGKVGSLTGLFGDQDKELLEHRRIKADMIEYEKNHAAAITLTASGLQDATFKVIGHGQELSLLTGKISTTTTAHTQLTAEQQKATAQSELRIAQLKLEIAEQGGNEAAIHSARAAVEKLTAAHLLETTGSKGLADQQAALTAQLEAMKDSKERATKAAAQANEIAKAEIEIRQGFGALYDVEGNKFEELYVKKLAQIDEFAKKDGVKQGDILALRQELEASYYLASEIAAGKHFEAVNDALDKANTKYLDLDGDKLAKILLNASLEDTARVKQISDLTKSTQDAGDKILAMLTQAKANNIEIGDEQLAGMVEQLNQHKSNVDLNLAAITEAYRSAGITDVQINQDTINAIESDETLSAQERIAKIVEYVKAVGKNSEDVRKISDELSLHNIDLATDEWSKKVQKEYDYYDAKSQIIQNMKVDEEVKSKLFEQLASETNANILKIDEDYATAHGGILDKLAVAWEGLQSDTVGKVDATFKFFRDTLGASATFFKESFMAIITGDIDRLTAAFGNFAASILKAFEDLAAQMVAKQIFAWLKELWDWLHKSGDEAEKAQQKIEDMGNASGGPIGLLATAVGSLTAGWMMFNAQIAISQSLLSRMPSLSAGGGAGGGIWNLLGNLNLGGIGKTLGSIDLSKIMDTMKTIGGFMAKIPGLSAIGVPLAGAGLGFGSGKLIGNIFGMSDRGSNILGGALGGGIGVGLGVSAIAEAIGIALSPFTVGLSAILGAILGGVAGSFFGGLPPHKKVLLKGTFGGIERGAGGGFTPGDIDIRASSWKEISKKDAFAMADALEKMLKGTVQGWSDVFNRFPPRLYDALWPEIQKANESLAHEFERMRFSTRDDLAALVGQFIRSSSKRVTREYLEPFKEGVKLFFGEFADPKFVDDLGATFDKLFQKLTSGNKKKFELLPSALDSIMSVIDSLESNRGLFVPADIEAVGKALKQTFGDIGDLVTGPLSKDDLSKIEAQFKGLQDYLQAVVSFLGEQQAVIEQKTVTKFEIGLKDLESRFEKDRQRAEDLGLSLDKLHEAESIQLQDYFVESVKPLTDLFDKIGAESHKISGIVAEAGAGFAEALAGISNADPEKALASAEAAFNSAEDWFSSLTDFGAIAAQAGDEIARLSPRVLQSLPETQALFTGLAGQISDMALELRGGIFEEMAQALQDAEVLGEEIISRRQDVEAQAADIQNSILPAYAAFFASLDTDLDRLWGRPLDHLADFQDALAKVSGTDFEASLTAAGDAIDALHAWFEGLGDFASVAQEAARKVLDFETSTIEGIQARIGDLTGAAVTNTSSAIAALTSLVAAARNAPLEERAAIIEQLEESLKLAEDLNDRVIRAQQEAISKDAVDRDAQLQGIADRGADNTARIIDVWRELQSLATDADQEARAVATAKMEEVRAAVQSQQQSMETHLGSLDQQVQNLEAQEKANADFLLAGWRELQSLALQAQDDAKFAMVDKLQSIQEAILAERDTLGSAISAMSADIIAALWQTLHPEAATPMVPAQHGMDFVPFDSFPISAHKGEAVITARGNEALGQILETLRSGGGQQGGDVTIVINPQPINLDGRQIAKVTFEVLKEFGAAGVKLVPSSTIYNK